MNLVTAAKMLVLLEQSSPSGDDDDSYHIIMRLLKREVRRAEDIAAYQAAQHDFMLATLEESMLATHDKVRAIKMYRTRTQSGLYHAKQAVEAGARLLESGCVMDDKAVGLSSESIAARAITSCN